MTPREPVLWFAGAMERKLRANDHKGGWRQCELGYLSKRLHEEANELSRVLRALKHEKQKVRHDGLHDHAREVVAEAADVANFAMMIADQVRHLLEES